MVASPASCQHLSPTVEVTDQLSSAREGCVTVEAMQQVPPDNLGPAYYEGLRFVDADASTVRPEVFESGRLRMTMALQAGRQSWLRRARSGFLRPEEAEPPGGPAGRLERALASAFDEQPIEDGVPHAAEAVLDGALRPGQRAAAQGWLAAQVGDPRRADFAASVLRCVGRLPAPGDAAWRADIVRRALGSPDPILRDAAVQAVEGWEDPALIPVLRAHRDQEDVPWLKEYLEGVIEDLEA